MVALWVCLALIALATAPYLQVSGHEFLVCDDDDYVTANRQVQAGLTWAGVRWAFLAPHASNWHPLTWLSHMLDCQLFGLNAGPHHLVNIAFHAANTVLLFLALRMMTGATWRSAAVAALFAVHPLRVESVAWVSERKDVLSGFFWMLTLLSYAWYVRRPGAWRYIAVLAAFVLGLLSKPMLVTMPFVLLLLDVWPFERGTRKAAIKTATVRESVRTATVRESVAWDAERGNWPWRVLFLEKAPLLALAIAVSVMAVVSQGSSGALKGVNEVAIGPRFANAAISYVAYLWQMVWPVNLAPFYPHPVVVSRDLFADFYLPAMGAALLLIATTLVLIRPAKRQPWLAIGWFWYLGTLVPVIGLVQIGAQSRADRYTYVPMIGIGIALVWTVGAWVERAPRARRPVCRAAAGALLAACLVLTWAQVARWRTDIELFEYTVRVTRKNYFAYNQLGTAYHKRRDSARAEESFANALRILPDYDFGNSNLGVYLMARGEFDAARRCFERALKANSRFVPAYRNMALLHSAQNRDAEALPYGEQAVRLDPENAGARGQLATIHEQLGRDAEADREYRLALALDPLDAANLRNFGLFHAAHARLPEAATWLERSLRLDAASADGWNGLGVVYVQLGQRARGISCLEQALRIAPDHASARRNLAILREP